MADKYFQNLWNFVTSSGSYSDLSHSITFCFLWAVFCHCKKEKLNELKCVLIFNKKTKLLYKESEENIRRQR